MESPIGIRIAIGTSAGEHQPEQLESKWPVAAALMREAAATTEYPLRVPPPPPSSRRYRQPRSRSYHQPTTTTTKAAAAAVKAIIATATLKAYVIAATKVMTYAPGVAALLMCR